jgi:hypothetical protein
MQTSRTYRVYRLDGRGNVRSGEWLDAADDDDARQRARSHCDAGTPAVEVWERARLVGRVDCAPEPPPTSGRAARRGWGQKARR